MKRASAFSVVRTTHKITAGAIVIVMAFLGFASFAGAHNDPANCDSTGVSLSLTVLRADGTTPVGGGSVQPGETIKYRATLSFAGGTNCNYEGGNLNINTPDGTVHDVDGGTISLITSGSPFVGSIVPYVVDSVDVVAGHLPASAVYSGGTSHLGGDVTPIGATTPASTLFQKINPGIVTHVHNAAHQDITSGTVAVGTLVHDDVVVSKTGSGATPTGNVVYLLKNGSTCTGSLLKSESGVLVSGEDESTATGALAAGSYSYSVSYGGDANYNSAIASCEPFSINKASPGILTTPSAGGPIGTVLNDIATLSGGSSPTGSVTFKLFPPSDATCAGIASYTDTDPTAPYATSPGFTSTASGTYRWTADYAGDANNNPVSSGCQDELVTVSKISPSIQTTPSAGGPIGTVLNDTATLSGGSSPTGNVVFNLFSPSDAICAGPAVYTDTDPAAPYATSPGFTSNVAGTYHWTADYAGDANNNAISSGCQAEPVVVEQLQGCTLTQGYWKTHNNSFKGGAPTNATWLHILPSAEQTKFFLSGTSWFGVFNTPPKGNAYYNLADQYMAAVLNGLNGAAVPANVQTAINSATALFNTYTPAQVAAFKGNNAVRAQFISLAGLLGSYNEGAQGVPHCAE